MTTSLKKTVNHMTNYHHGDRAKMRDVADSLGSIQGVIFFTVGSFGLLYNKLSNLSCIVFAVNLQRPKRPSQCQTTRWWLILTSGNPYVCVYVNDLSPNALNLQQHEPLCIYYLMRCRALRVLTLDLLLAETDFLDDRCQVNAYIEKLVLGR